jgi:nitrite reductase (NADH) small subunit
MTSTYKFGWKDVCPISDIQPFSGMATVVGKEQVAVFRLRSEDEVYAISNYDPFSHTYALSNGVVGDRAGIIRVTSPVYKHSFNLKTGECLEDSSVTLQTWEARVINGFVQVSLIRRTNGRG